MYDDEEKIDSIYYNNNPFLKRVGVKAKFNDEEISEMVKCRDDYLYFIKNYAKIVSLDDEDLINFNLFGYQERFLDAIHNNRKVISLQPRQMGKTTVVAAYMVWYIVFHSNKNVAILANKAETAIEILSRIKLMYENLPMYMKHGVKKWNEKSIHIENGSKIFAAATSKNGIRGKSCNMLYVDEAAIIDNTIAEKFFTAIYPVISAGKKTKIILTSTSLGFNHFWRYWDDAINDKNGFIPVRVYYDEHPDRDENWANEQRETLGPLMFSQEVLCEFLGSSNTLISGEALSKMTSRDVIFEHEGLDILENVKVNHKYLITLDTGEGVGGDYSAFTIFDITSKPFRTVGKYRSKHISHLLLPNIVDKVGREYCNAYVLIETNGIGTHVAHILATELEYENIITVATKPKLGQCISFSRNTKYGVKMSVQVKRLGCKTLKTLVESNNLLIFDDDTILELRTFTEVNGTFKADDGYNDDLCMTLVLFGWAFQDPLFADITDTRNRTTVFEKQLQEIDDNMLPVGFYFNGTESEEDDGILANF
jgi:hypothetical protein